MIKSIEEMEEDRKKQYDILLAQLLGAADMAKTAWKLIKNSSIHTLWGMDKRFHAVFAMLHCSLDLCQQNIKLLSPVILRLLNEFDEIFHLLYLTL